MYVKQAVVCLELGGAELGGGWFDVALPVLAGEHRAATLTSVGCRRGIHRLRLEAQNGHRLRDCGYVPRDGRIE
jgi:hypothetical protein